MLRFAKKGSARFNRLILTLILLAVFCFYYGYAQSQSDIKTQTVSESIIASALTPLKASNPINVNSTQASVEFFLCPQSDCANIFAAHIEKANQSDCAFYSVSDPRVAKALNDKRSGLVMDHQMTQKKAQYPPAVFAPQRHTMHDKFCVLDNETVITGTYNPSTRSNQDLVLILRSKDLATQYEDEFQEMRSKTFGGGKPRSLIPTIQTDNGTIQSLFCPEDSCEDSVAQILHKARDSIRFQAFSLTSEEVAKALIEAQKRGVKIKGETETSQEGLYSKVPELKKAGLDITVVDNLGLLHRKLFIVDHETIITGSANPTFSGYHENDENILIIKDPIIANSLEQSINQEKVEKKDPKKEKSPI